jgi:hypothetical protein
MAQGTPTRSSRRRPRFNALEVLLLMTVAAIIGASLLRAHLASRERASEAAMLADQAPVIEALYKEIQPVALSNCALERFGERNDGGYLVCGNLLQDVSAGYSYGINGYDGWGCEVSRRLKVPVHQYDCFNLTEPVCEGGTTRFHAECVGPTAYRDSAGRIFDTMHAQMAANGDGDRRVVLKIDVEGAEWDAFAQMDEDTLARIDQLVVEFHLIHEARFLAVVRKLKRHFEIVHLHYNNSSCTPAAAPHPATVFEALLVSKRLAIVDRSAPVQARPHPLDARNNTSLPDCQN